MMRFTQVAMPRRMFGVTLIELMIAMVLGLLVMAGIITVFVNTSRSNQVQSQMARLQEDGRFAIGQLTDSLRMTNAGFCSNSGGAAKAGTTAGAVAMDGLRSPTVLVDSVDLADNTTPYGATGYPALPSAVHAMPSFLYMRGYDCDATGTCTPMDPHDTVNDIPASGTGVGDRVVGTDVLTLRYLDNSEGWSLGSNDTVTADANFNVKSFTIVPEASEPAINSSTFTAGDVFLYGDCSTSYVFAGAAAGGNITVAAVSGMGPNYQSFTQTGNNVATKLFDFSKSFKTVTWYLRVVTDDSDTGHKTGALMRRVNGQAAEEVVRGVERLDFRYGVQDVSGRIRFLTANEIDAGVSGVECPVQPPTAPGGNNGRGCLWRAVRSIEVSMLVDGQQAMNSLEPSALAYSYSVDSMSPKPPDDASHAVKYSDQGFERGLMRREFNALVSVRNFNP